MTDRPILFSAPMVRALLAGHKTQTRRILKPQPTMIDGVSPTFTVLHAVQEGSRWRLYGTHTASEPFSVRFAVGDLLWVKETVACGACADGPPSHWAPSFWRREQGTPANPNGLWYRADGLAPEKTITDRGRWRSAIHMPRWASRLTLTVTAVRVQRLQDISEDDARAEGMPVDYAQEPYTPPPPEVDSWQGYGRASFALLWSELHGPGSWAANPWVVALTFTVEPKNIGA